MSRLGKCTNFNAEHYWKDVYGQVHSCKCNFNQLDDDISDKADQGYPHCRYKGYPGGYIAYG